MDRELPSYRPRLSRFRTISLPINPHPQALRVHPAHSRPRLYPPLLTQGRLAAGEPAAFSTPAGHPHAIGARLENRVHAWLGLKHQPRPPKRPSLQRGDAARTVSRRPPRRLPAQLGRSRGPTAGRRHLAAKGFRATTKSLAIGFRLPRGVAPGSVWATVTSAATASGPGA